jgi:YHS domain-containing protein
MFSRVFTVLFLITLIFGIKQTMFAEDIVIRDMPQKSVNVENKICPVTGEKVDEKTKATYEYQGKIYNFCCAACIDEFKKDPKKYIEKVAEELQSKPKDETGHDKMEMSGSEMPADMQSMHY